MGQENNDERKFLDAKNDEELISFVAEEYADKGLTQEELMEAGHAGIAKAREKFKENNDYSFYPYASWWVHQRILQAIHERGTDSRNSENG